MRLKRVLGGIVLAIPLAAVLAIVVGYWLSDNDCGKAAAPGVPMKADRSTATTAPPTCCGSRTSRSPCPATTRSSSGCTRPGVNPLDWHYMRGTPYLMRLG